MNKPELILTEALDAINGVFFLNDIREVGLTDNLYTVIVQHIGKSVESAKPRNPVGRPKLPLELKRPVGRPKMSNQAVFLAHIPKATSYKTLFVYNGFVYLFAGVYWDEDESVIVAAKLNMFGQFIRSTGSVSGLDELNLKDRVKPKTYTMQKDDPMEDWIHNLRAIKKCTAIYDPLDLQLFENGEQV